MKEPGRNSLRREVKAAATKLSRLKLVNGDKATCMLLAAAEAKLVGKEKMICIEFGVASGSGVRGICSIAEFLKSQMGIECQVFGFDRIGGLPKLKDYRDHREIWDEGEFSRDNFDELQKSLPDFCKLIIGDIVDTVPGFVVDELGNDTPLGFVSMDVDLYSSTVQSLHVLKHSSENYLPFIPMHFDDVYGIPTYNDWCGERLAIREFNDSCKYRKIHHYGGSRQKIYMAQILDHPIRKGEQKSRFPLSWIHYQHVGLEK